MNKEKIITIVIGLLVGVLAAGGYFAAVKILPNLKKPPEKIIVQPAPIIPIKNETSLILDQPKDNSSTTDSPITISGKTLPGINLIIFGNAEEKIASADATGSFSAQLKLEDGENQISVTTLENKPITIRKTITLEISQ